MQKLAEICVHRPVFATMLIAAITVVGGVSFFTLGVDRYPRVETPVVSVTTTNPGATPENMETEITDRIEAAVNTVSGIDELRSTSTEGRSRVTISFDLSKNADVAAQEVRAKVDPVIRDLPETADPPVVQKQDPDSFPILMFSVSAPMPVVELTTFLEQNVQKRLESVNGVGEVLLFGARRREIQIQINPDRLNAYSLSTTDVAAALRSQNLELPGGRLEQGARELSVRTVGRLRSPEAFNDLVVATRGNSSIRIRDIGQVVDTGEVPTSVSMLDGRPALTVAIRKQSGVNTVALADAIKARMAEIQQTLPPNVEVRLVRDDSEFIKASLDAIEEHLVLGGILAAVIVLIFLRNFRTTLIAAVAIPTSIIGAFAVIAMLGFTLNQMTMLALTLMVGIVIDDAIVVLENIYRFVEEKGMSPFRAAIEGTREIGLAVMATTLALLAVFIPVGFLGGIVGRFMSSFGLTSAAAIAISLIVSFTLTPTLAARWIKPATADGHGHDGDAGSDASRRGFYRHVDRVYTALLQWSMAHRWLIVTTSVLVVLSIVPLYRASGINFTPVEDESRFQISVRLPVGSSIAATQSLVDRIGRDMLQNLPGVLAVQANAGLTGGGQGSNNSGSIFVRLKPIEERDVSQQALMLEARRLVQPYRKSAVISVQATGGLSFVGGRGAQIQYALVGPDLAKLDQYTARGTEAMDKSPLLVDADRTFQPGLPELRLEIDRRRAADLGVRIQDVSQTVNALIAGQEVTTFNAASDQYRGRHQGPGFVPAHARIDRVGDGAHGVGRARPAAQPGVVQRGIGPRADRSAQSAAADHDLGQSRSGDLTGRGTGGARSRVRLARHGTGLQPRHQRPVARAWPGGVLLRHRLRAVFRLHVHGARGAVRVVHPPDHDPADVAAGGAVRAWRLARVRPAAQHLFRAGRPAPLRHREEERDPADRPYDWPAREGDGAR